MKRKLSMLMSMILLVTSFVGCGEENAVNNVNNNVTTSPPIVDNYDNIDTSEVSEQTEEVEVFEFFPVPNDRDLTIHLADVTDVFRKIGDDISVSIGWIIADGNDGTDLELGSVNEGNLYYSSEYNLLCLNLFTDINQDDNEFSGSISGEQISLDYDLSENTITRNESSEYFNDDIDLIVDVMLSIYDYALTKVDESSNEESDDIDEAQVVNNEQEDDEIDYEIQIAELVDSPDKKEETTTQTEIPIIPAGNLFSPEMIEQLEAEKNDPNNYPSYKGSSVMELFAYDVNNYSMADFNVLMNDTANIATIEALNDYTSKTPTDYGYFIKTHNFETGVDEKHYVFLDNSNEMLVNNCKNQLTNSVRQASWLTHMTEENVTSAYISYMADNVTKSKELTNTDWVQKLSYSLKGTMLVESFEGEENGKVMVIPNSSSDYHMVKLNFNNGVEYSIQLLGDTMLQIYTSDLDKTLTYKLYSYNTVKDLLQAWASD